MRRFTFAAIMLLAFHLAGPHSGAAVRPAASPDPGGVLKRLSITSFAADGQNTIHSLATDSSGNVYVLGSTGAADFPVHNAAQRNFGDARIMRSTDLGITWTSVGSPAQDVNVVVPDPVAPQVFFAAGDSGIYKSTNGGQTWGTVYKFPSQGFAFNGALVIDPGNHLRLAALVPFSGALIRSLDGGETWSAGESVCPLSSCGGGQLFADPSGSGTFLVSSRNLTISRDWGATLHTLAPPGGGGLAAAAFDPSHPGWIYSGDSQGVAGTLSLSTDFGTTWTVKASPPTIFSGILYLAVDPDQPNTLVAATPDGLYKSTDGANSWARVQGSGGAFLVGGHQPFAMLRHSCGAAGGLFALGGFQQVAFSPDDGATWMTPQLSQVSSVMAGPTCAAYITRKSTTDAFVAKLAPDGTVLWATFLGGSDQEVPVALAVDTQGNAYVTGNTSSPDFPVTASRIGTPGQGSVFVTKYWPDGRLAYSVLIGGDSRNTANAIAVDALQNAYVAGGTNSTNFPVTPGTLVTSLKAGSFTGFLLKLSSTGGLVYGTFAGESYNYGEAILVDSAGSVTVAGVGEVPGMPPPQPNASVFLMKLDPNAARVVRATYLEGAGRNLTGQGASALATDAAGNLYVLGAANGQRGFPTTPGAYRSPQPTNLCAGYKYPPTGDVYVTKLAAADWQPIYSAMFGGQCGTQPGSMAVDSNGAVVFSIATGAGFPLHNPLLAGPTCYFNSSAVAKLSPDGSTLEFGTYLDDCGIPGIALAAGGSIYAGVTHGQLNSPAGVMRLNLAPPPAISLDRISNAFSGDAAAVVRGGLYSLEGSGFPSAAIDLGLNATQDLPTQLGGIQVQFDGALAQILQVGADRVIAAPPWNGLVPPARRRLVPGFTLVQVIYNGVASNPVWMPVAASLPGIMTRNFPNPQPFDYANLADANAYNEDGTVNDADHPAAAGSTITVFATGLGATSSYVAPGAIARSAAAAPVIPLYASWNRAPNPETVTYVPGFVSALLRVGIKVPNLSGAGLGNGVQRVSVGLLFTWQVYYYPTVSNVVSVYLK